MNYTTGQVMAIFSISRETVRNWSSEFAAFLSDSSKPGKGKHRVFSDEDMRVFALAGDLRRQGATHETIIANLASGQRGTPPQMDFTALAKTEQHQQIAFLQSTVMRLEAERAEAVERAHMLEKQSNEAQGQVKLLKEQLAEKEARIFELQKQIARLETSHPPD
jgi:DNA-binding transcriptional MerR regulator